MLRRGRQIPGISTAATDAASDETGHLQTGGWKRLFLDATSSLWWSDCVAPTNANYQGLEFLWQTLHDCPIRCATRSELVVRNEHPNNRCLLTSSLKRCVADVDPPGVDPTTWAGLEPFLN